MEKEHRVESKKLADYGGNEYGRSSWCWSMILMLVCGSSAPEPLRGRGTRVFARAEASGGARRVEDARELPTCKYPRCPGIFFQTC